MVIRAHQMIDDLDQLTIAGKETDLSGAPTGEKVIQYKTASGKWEISAITFPATLAASWFQARHTAGGTIATGPADVIFGVQDWADGGFSYNTGTGVLTIGTGLGGKKGIFDVAITGINNTGSRASLGIELMQNTGGGYAAIARSWNYAQRDVTHHRGGVWIPGFKVALTQGHLYKVQLTRIGNPSTYDSLGCWFSCLALG